MHRHIKMNCSIIISALSQQHDLLQEHGIELLGQFVIGAHSML